MVYWTLSEEMGEAYTLRALAHFQTNQNYNMQGKFSQQKFLSENNSVAKITLLVRGVGGEVERAFLNR